MERDLSFARQLEDKAMAVLHNNRRTKTKRGANYGFTCPSATLYHWQWLWDSCFHAIALRWNEPEFAKGELLSLIAGQWRDGRIPNMVHVGWNWRFDRIVHGTGRDTSGITQPPIIADAALRVFRATGDKVFLEQMYPSLVKYYNWLKTARELTGDGLISIYHPWESGIDNSPRWDNIFAIKNFSRRKFDITKGIVMFKFNFVRYRDEAMRRVSPFLVTGIDMNCYYSANIRALASIARELGDTTAAAEFDARAEKTAAAIRSRLWDDESQAFCDLIGTEQRKSYVPTLFSMLPMWAGIANRSQADKIHSEITNPEKCWTEYPVPTTFADYPAFDPNGYWRGTVWINTNWLMIEGLARNGFNDTANEIKRRTLEMVDREGFFEYYNPHTGQGLGTKDFGWSTLVIDLIHRNFDTPDFEL